MNPTALSKLKCPVCGSEMYAGEDGRTCRCRGIRTHSYDLSRSGYLNLAFPGDGEGDLKPAIRSRSLFLNAGYYEPLSDAVNGILNEMVVASVLDAGCGEGYYTNRMATPQRAVLGVDLSRAGIDSAAKRARMDATDAAFVVGSIFSLPAHDASFDAVTNIFAPCCEAEFLRVLKPGGIFIMVGAGERHLFGLKQAVYENPYLNPGRADIPQEMTELEKRRLRYEITVKGREEIEALFSMTPYYWRTSPADSKKLAALDTLTTEVDFNIYIFRKEERA